MEIEKISFRKLNNKFLIIILNCLIILFIFIRNKKSINNLHKNLNIKYLTKNNISSNVSNNCILVKSILQNRTQPFDYENELFFFIDLISCKIPFSFARFGDGENSIMKGDKIYSSLDKWNWDIKNKKFQESLIQSSSICLSHNNFIGIPCKNLIKISQSILSFSKCSSAKYISYTYLFVNKNYQYFKDWIIDFINSSKRWKIILVANSIIHKNIKWAYKYFPVPDNLVENWEKYSISLLSKLSDEAKKNNLIFFISAGPAANIIVSYLSNINNKNIYIDFGSSIEFITKGYTTRLYNENGKFSNESCEPFFLKNKKLIYKK